MQTVHTTIDKLGRLVLPKEMRDHLGLRAGTPIEIEELGNEVVIRAVAQAVPMKMIGGVLVFTGKAAGDLESVLQQQREERVGRFK